MSIVNRALPTRLSPARSSLLGTTLLCALAASCSSEETPPESFIVRNTEHAAASATEPLRADKDWMAYRLSEASQGAAPGTDFNGDGDTNDSIAVRENTRTRSTEVLNVAALELAFVDETLFILVDETQDGTDWNGDTDLNDRVLLFHAVGTPDPVFYDEVPSGLSGGLVSAAGRLLYPSATAPTASMESNLYLAAVAAAGAAPAAPAMVLTGTDLNNDGISYSVQSEKAGFVFLLADETVDGELNGDGDAVDNNILAVVDAGALTPQIVNVELALDAATSPDAVPVAGGGEWLAAFLVDEASQNENLNDPSRFSSNWQPANCAAAPDTDEADAVLHWFQLGDLITGTPAVNTGLVGADQAYAMIDQFVGVVSPENEEGSGGGCDLNGDTDTNDLIFRWVAAADPLAPVLPVTSSARLHAVRDNLPGGSGGVVALEDTWAIVVDEVADGRNHDGEPSLDQDLVAAHVPSVSGQSWNFNHGSTFTTPVGVTWIQSDTEDASRFFAAITEESLEAGLGAGYNGNGDGDFDDSISTIPTVSSGNRLTFPGVAYAVASNRPGLRVKQNVGVHRISEAAQGGLDINGDGDATDFVLQRFSITGAFASTYFATADDAPTPASYFQVGAAEFGGFLTDEFMAGGDLNGDGDLDDLVVRYYRLP
ncbi:MAG: hypothetical protein P8M11_09875 [Planctomycetota bacterium]|nr:hypothetical protein [Planctomycetota bacterium]MDG1984865.1 hypothetical protein [Planctomycetota bacterium]